MNQRFIERIKKFLSNKILNNDLFVSIISNICTSYLTPMHYKFSLPHPQTHYLHIDFTVDVTGEDFIDVKLPSWRPGRYELGNFAKNVQQWKPVDESGNELAFKKVSKDCWRVQTKNVKQLKVSYTYYANQLDAGACYADASQVYINPVHCCLYVDEKVNEKCSIEFSVDKNYLVGTSLKQVSPLKYEAISFDELVDSPCICSPTLQHLQYEVDKIPFHVWIQGDCNADEKKLIADFKNFTEVQLKTMQTFPFEQYHFLIQATPHSFYHGVEHLKNTVLAIGPAISLNRKDLYNELLGVASHELFHAWNIKTIRPVEMQPYDLTKENYAETGYVYEGVTTYYGDLFLKRSGFFTEEEYLNEISIRINKHLNNEGRFNHSVAQSSFDTWLDGYVPGVPGRKISIYDEGSLISLMLDFLIRKYSDQKFSLDDVMKKMYDDLGKKGIGYSANDYQKIAEGFAGRSLEDFFSNYLNKATSYESLFKEVITFAGLELVETKSSKTTERMLGMIIEDANALPKIVNIAKNSPAFAAGLSIGDELISINGHKADKRTHDLFSLFTGQDIELDIFSQLKKKTVRLKLGDKNYFSAYSVRKTEKPSTGQVEFYKNWLH